MASAYCEAGHDIHKASEIICNMLGSSSSNDIPISTDDLTTSSVGSDDNPTGKSYETRILSQPKPTNPGVWVGTVSSLNGADNTRSATSINEPPKVLSRSKPKSSGISVGTVSGIIGADYGRRTRASTKEALEITKPVKLMSNEFPASQIWDEPQPNNGTMNKDVEQFLLKMLGDGFKLDMGVIKEVVGGCGYDVRESMEKLMDMSSPTLDLRDVTSSVVDQTKSMDTYRDLGNKREEKLQFRASGSGSKGLERDVLCNLFTVPERPEVGLRKILPKNEPRTQKYGLVTEPLEDRVTELRSPIVMKEGNVDGNEQIEDNYETLREAAMEFWITMKKYYIAAADAFVKGSYELAYKLVEEGHFFMAKAREADETSAKMLIQTRTKSNGPSSISTCSNDDDKNLEWLFEAFGSKISIDDMASAFCEAGHDIHKASEIICNMLGSSSSNDIPISTDDLTTSSVGSDDNPTGKSYETRILSQPKPTNPGVWVGTVSSLNGADNTRSATSINEPPKVLSRSKPKSSGISVGTVSGIIGADYGRRTRDSTKEALEITKPVKLMSNEFPASQIWDELQPNNGTMNKDVEQFLLKMLGDGFKLDMGVIKKVAGGCGYDVRESMEKLMDMSSPTLDLRDVTSSVVVQTKSMDTYRDLGNKREEKLQFRASGSGREGLEREVLCNLFTVPERPEVGLRKILPKREPRTRKYGLVTEPLEDRVTELRSPIVMKEGNVDGNEQIEDNYETLREAAMEFWITMKKYYIAAADAYVKGSYELADKLVEEGHFFMAKAREADETSAKMLIQTRDDGEVISIDVTDDKPRDAIRLLKTQLKSMSGIPSIHYLKVMVGTENDITQKARKHLISKLLERDAISWTEEKDGQIMAIRIDHINPKRLSFNKK